MNRTLHFNTKLKLIQYNHELFPTFIMSSRELDNNIEKSDPISKDIVINDARHLIINYLNGFHKGEGSFEWNWDKQGFTITFNDSDSKIKVNWVINDGFTDLTESIIAITHSSKRIVNCDVEISYALDIKIEMSHTKIQYFLDAILQWVTRKDTINPTQWKNLEFFGFDLKTKINHGVLS